MKNASTSGNSPARPVITAFENSPDHGRGMARDMPVRWALEETGQDYDVRLVSFEAMKASPILIFNPSGRYPPMKRAIWRCLNPARSCFILRNRTPAFCRMTSMAGHAPSHGCSPRTTPSNR